MLILGCKPPKENPVNDRFKSALIYHGQLQREFPNASFIVKNVRGCHYIVCPHWTEEEFALAQSVAERRSNYWDQIAKEELGC